MAEVSSVWIWDGDSTLPAPGKEVERLLASLEYLAVKYSL